MFRWNRLIRKREHGAFRKIVIGVIFFFRVMNSNQISPDNSLIIDVLVGFHHRHRLSEDIDVVILPRSVLRMPNSTDDACAQIQATND